MDRSTFRAKRQQHQCGSPLSAEFRLDDPSGDA